MPVDIFTEVASHLMPEDIILLSRLSKFFRNLLMRRSAIHIWRNAMLNVPKLPPCPPDMCEPQYLALIYTLTCSICGTNRAQRINEVLRVRLCYSCFEHRLMPVDGLPPDVRGLVHHSSALGQPKDYMDIQNSALRSDVGAVLVKMEDFNKSGNNAALAAWKIKRVQELETRKKQAAMLSVFLRYLETQEIKRLEGLRLERIAEIKRRLTLLGWDERDFQVGQANQRSWDMLVNMPAAITEQVWADIKPRLISILQDNRTLRLEREKAQRKRARIIKLEQILEEIRDAEPLLIDARVSPAALHSSESNTSTIRIVRQRIFPLIVDLLEYPAVKELGETDVPDSEMEARLEEHRGVIEAHILEWRIKVEGHLADVIRKGRVSDGLKKAAPVSKLPVGESDPNPLSGLSDDLKLLLRADSLFESRIWTCSKPVTYDVLLAWSFPNIWSAPRTEPLVLASYKRCGKAQEIARGLLAGIGKTNASFLELQSMGQRFKCGSCQSKLTYTWSDIVQHYTNEQVKWKKFQAHLPEAEKAKIKVQNLHALDSRPKKSLLTLLDSIQHGSLYDYSGPVNFYCRLCQRIGVHDEGVTEDEVMEHIMNWHGVAEPRMMIHYHKIDPDYSDNEDEDEDGLSDSYGFGFCQGACCAAYHLDGGDDEDDDEDEEDY